MKKIILLSLLLLNLSAHAEKTPFGNITDGISPILDKISSGGASRIIERSKCDSNFNFKIANSKMLNDFKTILENNVTSTDLRPSFNYMVDSYERKLRALNIAYSDKTCHDTTNLNNYAKNVGL